MTNERTLWLVEIDADDWDYDEFVEAAVWADTAEEAESLVRAEHRYAGKERERYGDALWIKPEWRLHVRPAPTNGVVLVHWHAG